VLFILLIIIGASWCY
ncbi:MAG: YjcZ family sporulation protein, partial [Bacillus sp. (in: firmicutes)]